ncbi:MAG: hypothetical protein OZ921_07480 [Sorangiineae bacterium]|nr:hypothetical protein [Polyangiaceae bacterium]MEB2322338.1 hypothetical protein [Sorangiineae bacterium]
MRQPRTHRPGLARSVSRRAFAALTFALAVLAVAPSAWAGSYLDRAALLIGQATRDADYLRRRLTDRELARVAHQLAEARLDVASKMQIPPEVAAAHPHVLLVLSNYERATRYAEEGRTQQFLVYQQKAHEEERILRGILKELGWSLPKDTP